MEKEKFKKIGERLWKFRKQHGLKQDDFAAMVGIKKAAISRMENGGIKPNIELLLTLQQNYCLSIDWLISGKGSMHRCESQNLDFGEFSSTFQEMVENMHQNKAMMHAIFSTYHTKLVEINLLERKTNKEDDDD